MTYRHRARALAALLMAAFMLAAPITALAKKGEKNFKQGLQYEQAQQWEKAAQEFALAVAARPSDTEYQLHYRRAIFNASQVFMQKGRALADQGDYVGAYNAFRTAYGYDNVNELAADEMQRVLRLQRERDGTGPNGETKDGARVSPTSYRGGGANGVGGPTPVMPDGPPTRAEQLKNVNYSGELEPFIRSLADELNLNVIFDQNFAQVKRTINVKLKDVTAARTLDYIFQAYGLFFQRLDRRTILVADQSKRPVYQQLVLRTFYLNNIPTDEARNMIQAALPANAGRQPQVVMNKTTNSITVRDTPENMRIIADLIRSIDKDRAEVVMEVSIYEVTRTDLLQVGNQFGTAETLGNLGGLQTGSILFEGARRLAAGGTAGATIPVSTGVGLLIPSSSLALLQGKSNTKLVFSTQVHAFDDEKSETRIGSKVPVQTASVFSGLQSTPQQGAGGNATTGVFGNGFPVIQYEDTGLVLDFTPKVYPNQDVQVKMNIETKDVGAGPDPLTPSFTQRKISGVARIPNGKTMMIASVGQDRQSTGKTGLPLLGLIPILGRLFTAPRRDNTQSDVVITMTPRVLRAPMITPEDEMEKKSGSMQTPTTESLEAMLKDADREDQLARARTLPTNQTVQLPAPPGEEAAYVPAPKALAAAATNTANDAAGDVSGTVDATKPRAVAVSLTNAAATAAAPAGPFVVPATNDAAPPVPAANNANGPHGVAAMTREVISAAVPAESAAELLLLPEQQEAKTGEKRRVMVFMKTDAPLGLVTATLRFDPKTMAVRGVSQGMLAADKATAPNLTHSVDLSGVLVFSVAPAAGAAPLTGEGLLLIIEVEALAAGEGTLSFDTGKVHLIATDGRTVRAKATAGRIKVTQ